MPCNDNNIDTLTYILTGEVVNLIKVKLDNEQAPTMSDFANYISNLPSRFPEVNTRLFLLLASNLLTTCLRKSVCWVEKDLGLGGLLDAG